MKRRKNILEKYDKTKNQWVQVSVSDASEEALRIFDIMEAHLEIATVEEEIKMDINTKDKD